MSIRKIIKKIFVGILKVIPRVFLRRKIFGEISVEHLASISVKEFVEINSQENILKRNLKFILNLERV
jgi:hypothetical protein